MAMKNADRGKDVRRRRGGPRKRTGCATCKTRHIRCDEKSPVCANCERLGLQCRPSERITYSSWSNINATDLGPSAEAGVGAEAPSGQRERRQSHNMSPFVSQSLRPSSSASVSNHVTLSETGLGEIGGESAALPDDAEISQWSPSSAYTAQTSGSNPAVLDDEKAHLLSTFRTGLATWMDIFDFEDTYQREVSRLALQSDLLLRCICAFTAKHLSLLASGDVWAPTASRYYGEAVTLLIQALNTSEPDRNELTAVILLSSYEAIAESGVLHRSHYQGAMNLIRGRGISASSVGLDRVNFIIYVRHEITLALANEKPLQFDPSNWNIPPLGPRSTEDHMASYLMCLSGSTVNLIFRRSSPKERSVLIERVDDWFKRTNSSFQGTPHGSISKEGLQKVYFTLPTAAAAMLWYHLTCILLYAEPDKPSSFEHLVQDHAKSILNITSSDLPNCVRCFSIMPIYFAGKHTTDMSKQLRAYTQLKDIEKEVGYRTQSRVRSLERIMGQPGHRPEEPR